MAAGPLGGGVPGRRPVTAQRSDPPPLGWSYYQDPPPVYGTRLTPLIRQPKTPTTAVIRLKATYTDPPAMARSKSKNKTLAVGDTAHAGIAALQERLGLKNHDETIRYLLDYYCSSELTRAT